MLDLSGKTALITGASGGIGEAVARIFCQAGARLIVSGTNIAKINSLAADLQEHVIPIACNLGDRASTAGLIQKATESLGPIDILVNNAGITRDGLLLRMADKDWDQLLEINLSATMVLCRAVLRTMIRNRFGRIINITSVTGTTGNAGQSNYAASKAAIIGFSKSLAAEVAARGITVNCISPGLIETNMTDKLSEERKKLILATVPVGRIGKPDDIANSVLFLASEQASYITGQTLHVNGGMVMV